MMLIVYRIFLIVPFILCTDAQSQIKCYHCANVTHTYECSNTVDCFGPYESCSIHANHENGKVTYTQGCMSSHLCGEGQTVSIIGRSVDRKKKQEQEFQDFQCCTDNLCNTHDSEVSGLVFKVSTHVGGDDVSKAWTDGVYTKSDDNCRNVRALGCSKHYRHPAIDNWLAIKRDLIKYAIYKDEKEVASIWLNGTGSTMTDWFSHGRFINSTWTDLQNKNTHIFSIQGGSWTRRFSIQKAYGGCPQDYGWTVIIASRHSGYCNYDDLNIVPPYIMYSKGNTSGHYSEGFDFADAAAIYIYSSDM